MWGFASVRVWGRRRRCRGKGRDRVALPPPPLWSLNQEERRLQFRARHPCQAAQEWKSAFLAASLGRKPPLPLLPCMIKSRCERARRLRSLPSPRSCPPAKLFFLSGRMWEPPEAPGCQGHRWRCRESGFRGCERRAIIFIEETKSISPFLPPPNSGSAELPQEPLHTVQGEGETGSSTYRLSRMFEI